jgi:hypothetical protein
MMAMTTSSSIRVNAELRSQHRCTLVVRVLPGVSAVGSSLIVLAVIGSESRRDVTRKTRSSVVSAWRRGCVGKRSGWVLQSRTLRDQRRSGDQRRCGIVPGLARWGDGRRRGLPAASLDNCQHPIHHGFAGRKTLAGLGPLPDYRRHVTVGQPVRFGRSGPVDPVRGGMPREAGLSEKPVRGSGCVAW